MKIECWFCGCEYDETEDFCPECESPLEPFEVKEDQFVRENQKKCSNFEGAWIVVPIVSIFKKSKYMQGDVPLYTQKYCDKIKHRETGQKYKRGEHQVFWKSRGEVFPELIEDSGEYDFIYYNSDGKWINVVSPKKKDKH